MIGGGSKGAARVPDSCLGWDCSCCDDSDVCGGSRRKGDGSGSSTGLLPVPDSALWGGEEHSLLVLAPVVSSRLHALCCRCTGQRLCLSCLLSPYASARGRHSTTVSSTWEAVWVWKELSCQICLDSKLGPTHY